MSFSNTVAAGALRMGLCGIYQSIGAPPDELMDNVKIGATIGACYVLSRTVVSLCGRRINSLLESSFGLDPKKNPHEFNKLGVIKVIVHTCLWVPTIAMTCHLANVSGNPTSFAHTAKLNALTGITAFMHTCIMGNIQKRYNLNFPLILPIFVGLDPQPEQTTLDLHVKN